MREQIISTIRTKLIHTIVIIGIMSFVILTTVTGKNIYDRTIGLESMGDVDQGIEYVYQHRSDILDKFYSYHSEEIAIPSRNGYDIKGIYIEAQVESDKVAVIVNDSGTNKWGSIEWAYMYLDEGYNVIMYNQRSVGGTGGEEKTFGYYEKYDVASVIDYIHEHYQNKLVGIHGLGMGAATVGLYAGLEEANKKIDFYILDSAYDTMEGIIKTGLGKEQHKLAIEWITWTGDIYLKLKEKFGYKDLLVKEAVKNSSVPMLVIHGDADTRYPIEMGVEIYNNKQKGYKDIWIIEDVGHMEGYIKYPEEYTRRVMEFIEVSTYTFNKSAGK